MSHSTTATATYVISKYSRSYPSNAAQTQSNYDASASDWQHFTNPVIRLILDTKKSSSGDLESVRLRILWQMSAGNMDDVSNQPEVVFEDLDLFLFSSLASRIPQNHNPQGLPLKAVHRGTVVGIRYLHPRDSIATPMYRRFQISFATDSAVLEFINAIKTVCPCKSNPNTALGNVTQPIQQISQARPYFLDRTSSVYPPVQQGQPTPPVFSQPSQTTVLLAASRGYSQTNVSSPLQPVSSDAQLVSASGAAGLYPFQQFPPNGSLPLNLPPARAQSQIPLAPNLAIPPTHLLKTGPASWNAVSQAPPVEQNLSAKIVANPDATFLSSSLPPSSERSLNQISDESHDKDFNISKNTQQADALFSSFREATALYDASPAVLEQIVGDVIREDGFAKLLEALDSLWRMKVLAGQ